MKLNLKFAETVSNGEMKDIAWQIRREIESALRHDYIVSNKEFARHVGGKPSKTITVNVTVEVDK